MLKRNDETEDYFDVGDEKAAAKTSQALREKCLEVRATKVAPSRLLSGVNPPRRRKKRIIQIGTSNADAKKFDETCQTHTSESPSKKAQLATSPLSQTNRMKEEECAFYFSNSVTIPHSTLKKKIPSRRRSRNPQEVESWLHQYTKLQS